MNNVVPIKKPWHLAGIRAVRVKMRYEETNEVVDGTQFHLTFTDQRPSVIQTKQGGNHKAVQFAIPDGTPLKGVCDLFRQLPDEIEKHLTGETHGEPEAKGESKSKEDDQGTGRVRPGGPDSPKSA